MLSLHQLYQSKISKIHPMIVLLSFFIGFPSSAISKKCPTLSPSEFPQKGIGNFCSNNLEPFFSPNNGGVYLRIKAPYENGNFEYCDWQQINTNFEDLNDGDVLSIQSITTPDVEGDSCTYQFTYLVQGYEWGNGYWTTNVKAIYKSPKQRK